MKFASNLSPRSFYPAPSTGDNGTGKCEKWGNYDNGTWVYECLMYGINQVWIGVKRIKFKLLSETKLWSEFMNISGIRILFPTLGVLSAVTIYIGRSLRLFLWVNCLFFIVYLKDVAIKMFNILSFHCYCNIVYKLMSFFLKLKLFNFQFSFNQV